MNFSEIVGQEEIIKSLEKAVNSGRIGHAYVFTGPSGIGKRTVASIFAGMLLCDMPEYSQPCSRCQACRLFLGGSNPDFRRIICEGLSIGVDEIRDILNDVAIKPMYSKRKVYIIEEADKMTAQAQNCLLKTLEEPPAYVVIILTASNYSSLLETIRSRSQRLNFKKNSYEQVRQVLEYKYGMENKGIEFAAVYADGIIGTALELVDSEVFISLRDKTIETISRIKSSGLSGVFSEYTFFEENKDDLSLILDMMSMYYRDLLIVKETGNEKILINSDKRDIIFSNAKKYTAQQLVSCIEGIESARRAIKQNANFQLAVEHMLIKLQEE